MMFRCLFFGPRIVLQVTVTYLYGTVKKSNSTKEREVDTRRRPVKTQVETDVVGLHTSSHKKSNHSTTTTTSIKMKFTILKLTAFAMLATASGVYASGDSDEPSSQSSLRGSFLSEEGNYWYHGQGAWDHYDNGWTHYGGPQRGSTRDISSCKTNCQCPEGKA